MPAFARAILIQESAEGGLSYKVKNRTVTVSHGGAVSFITYSFFERTSVINALFFFCKQLLCNLPERPFPEAASRSSCWCHHRSLLR